MNGHAVSVVIPTRDRPHLLALTLRSVLAQSDVRLEVIIVDDGERAGTAALVGNVADERVRLLRNDGPHGVSQARNLGLAAAAREWVAFCDDDDLWAPDKLARQLAAAGATGRRWVYAGDVSVGPDLQVLTGVPPPNPERLVRDLGCRNSLPAGASNVVVRRETLARAGRFDPRLHATEDWDLWLRVTRVGGTPAWVCRPLVAYRFHPLNTMADADRFVTEPRILAHRYGIPVDVPAMYRRAAWNALRRGRRGEAIRHYARAIGRGDLLSVARIAHVLARRRVAGEAMFRSLPADRAWMADAEPWLARLRDRACAAAGQDWQGRQ